MSKRERHIKEIGLDRAFKSLEIDNFIKTQMQLRVAFKALFTSFERFLIRNNQVFVLNPESSKKKKLEVDSNSEDSDFNLYSSNSPHFTTLLSGALIKPQPTTANQNPTANASNGSGQVRAKFKKKDRTTQIKTRHSAKQDSDRLSNQHFVTA